MPVQAHLVAAVGLYFQVCQVTAVCLITSGAAGHLGALGSGTMGHEGRSIPLQASDLGLRAGHCALHGSWAGQAEYISR